MKRDLKALEREFARLLKGSSSLRSRMAKMATARISARSTRDFMAEGPRKRTASDTHLIMQTQRLARAVMGGPGSRNRIEIKRNITLFILEIFVPYAAIHEYGGTINLAITVKMRRFFWAMWFSTKDEKWKGMALTKKAQFTIHMPKRAYIQPAIDSELPEIQMRAAQMMVEFIQQTIGS